MYEKLTYQELEQRLKELEENIQKRKSPEEKFLSTDQQFENIVQSLPDPTFVINKSKRIVAWNRAIEEMTGLLSEDMVGKGDNAYSIPFWGDARQVLADFIMDPDLGDFSSYESVKREGDSLVCEAFLPNFGSNDGGIHVWLKASPLYDKDGVLIGAIESIRDITKQKQAEGERKRLKIQLQQAQKMESIGTLAGGIAHDFNNILFPILGHTELLLEDIPESSPLRDSLDKIYISTLRAKDLVKQILTFSRRDSSEFKPLEIKIVIKEALKLIRSTIPTTIDIKQDIRDGIGVINADPTQIHQIIMNLSTNAYHAMEKTGGELSVRLYEIELGENDIMRNSMTPGIHACLTIADTGIGMDKNLRGKIFDPFFTTKEHGKGTGIGLSVVHGIVLNMNGAIEVNSEPGKGTEFIIYLPMVRNFLKKQESNQTKRSVQKAFSDALKK